MSQPTPPPHKVAFIIDNVVVEILYVDVRLAAILLSEPKVVEVTELLDSDPYAVRHGSLYDSETGAFTNPITGA